MAEQITGWKAKDGEIFEKEVEADLHNAALAIQKSIGQVVSNMDYDERKRILDPNRVIESPGYFRVWVVAKILRIMERRGLIPVLIEALDAYADAENRE